MIEPTHAKDDTRLASSLSASTLPGPGAGGVHFHLFCGEVRLHLSVHALREGAGTKALELPFPSSVLQCFCHRLVSQLL